MFWVSLLLESGSSDRDIAINTAKGLVFARLLQGCWLGRGGRVGKRYSPLQNTHHLPKLPLTAHHDDKAHFLPIIWGNHCCLPDEWQHFRCFRLAWSWPHPLVLRASGMTRLESTDCMLSHSKTAWSHTYQEQFMDFIILQMPCHGLVEAS